MSIDLESRMHYARWGDPAKAQPVSESLRGLVDTFLGGAEDRPAVEEEQVELPDVSLSDELIGRLRELVGAEHVHTDHEWRVARTRGKSTPDLLKMRSGDGSEAPDVVVRPAGHDEVASVVSWCAEHRVAVVPFGGGASGGGGVGAGRHGDPGGRSLGLRPVSGRLAGDEGSGTGTP